MGKRLRETREQSGYSVEEMCKLLDTTERHYTGVENGEYLLNPHRLYILKRVLGIDLDWLFFGEESEPGDIVLYHETSWGEA